MEKKPENKFQLQAFAYSSLSEYGLHSHYAIAAVKVAYSLYKNKTRRLAPRVKRAFVKLDNQSYSLNHLLLRIPTTPRNFIFLALQVSEYHQSLMDNPNLMRGSITINEKWLSIAYSKRTSAAEPIGFIGVDVNERNVTVSTGDGFEHRFQELAVVAELRERYRDIRSKIDSSTRGDRRIATQLLSKYGKRERNRSVQLIHRLTKRIVSIAKQKQLGIKLENLKGIRKLYRGGNGKGRSYRGRMNSWAFREVQRQIAYKASWESLPVYFVNPRGTSSNCPDCGSRVTPMPERRLFCQACRKNWDRDDLASKNIMACVVPQDRPARRSREGEPLRTDERG